MGVGGDGGNWGSWGAGGEVCGAEEHLGIWSLAGVVKGRGASSGSAEPAGPESLGGAWCCSQALQRLEDIGVGLKGLN